MAIVIVSAQDAPAYDADGRLVTYRIVVYKVDDMGPFGFAGPASELTTDEIHRRIRAEAAELRRLKEGL